MRIDLLYGRMCGEWHARGVNHYAPTEAVSELFVLELGNDCELAGRNCDSSETDQYYIESVHIYRPPPVSARPASLKVEAEPEAEQSWRVRFVQR